MKKYLHDFLEYYDFPMDSRALLEEALAYIEADKELHESFQYFLKCYDEDINYNLNILFEWMTGMGISFKAGIHEYTGYLLLIICLSKRLKNYYEAAGVSEEIWHTSMNDIKWKMLECKDVYGIYGIFVPGWYAEFFSMKRFGLGKLQFELTLFGENYHKQDVCLTPKSSVIDVHLPRTGTKLSREDMKEAYKKATDFFGTSFVDKPIVFVCNSWLLFPRNKEFLSPESNLYGFISDYEIVAQGEDGDYWNLWRVYGTHYMGDITQMPQVTSMQRAYAKWIKEDTNMGWGYGVYVYHDK